MGRRRKIQGIVVSDKMDKTVTVEVRNLTPHSLYGKIVRRRTRLKVHNPANTAREGDVVVAIESRPYSKTKRWALLDVTRRSIDVDEGVK